MARAILSVLVTVTSLAAASLAAQCDTVFQDGFESGDASGWEVWRPPPCTTWQWQLSGVIDTSYDVAMYDIDLFETSQATIVALHAAGRRVICYLSAGSWESWRPDAGSFPEGVLGNALAPPFADERWLDVRQVAVLGPIVGDRMDLAVSKGCDGVEPDNVDGYANDTGFPISYQDQLVYNRLLAAMAHQRGLSVGLKNDLEQIGDLVASFDWALDEQCWQYDECELLLPFVERGKAVFGVEYVGDPEVFCPPLAALGYSWLKKHVELDAWRIDCRAP